MKPRHSLLLLALAATLAAVFWPQRQDDVVTAVARGSARPSAAAGRPGQAPSAPLPVSPPGEQEAGFGAMKADLFPAQTWRPPPPPPPKWVPVPPPPPLPPPLPFQYLGRWRDGGVDIIFLGQGERVIHARVGDSLNGWHLDQAGTTALTFTWSALNMQQTLRIAP